jgi:hypothetical protein
MRFTGKEKSLMRRFFKSILIVGAIAAFALTGCGGGGGGTSTPGNPILGDGVISGKVVSNQSGSPGVAKVVVRLGSSSITATTDSNGYFELKPGSSSAAIPAYFQVDPTGAGTGYSKSFSVVYDSQKFYSDNITVPVEIRNGDSHDLGTITITHVSDDDIPPIPDEVKNTVLTGRIIRSDTSVGIANVSVSFGTPAYNTIKTGAKGYFEINLGLEAAVLPLLPGDKVFSIDTSTAGSDYPASLSVSYGNSSTLSQSSIPVPSQIYTNQATDFGDIKIVIGSNSGGDGPPDPPGF